MNTEASRLGMGKGRWRLPLVRWSVGVLLVGLGGAAVAHAAGAASAPGGAAKLRGFVVEGNNPLSAREESLALAPFLRADLTLETLQQAVQALEDALKASGHSLHRVVLAPQEVTDTVRLEVVSFGLGEVTVEGAQAFGVDNIRRSLPALQPGATPDLAQLAVQTALANENPAKNVQVALRASPTQPDRIDVTVRVKDSPPWQWAASLSNTGSVATGRDRLTVSGGHANLWDRDHQLAAAYTTSLARPSDVSQLGLTYRLPLYAAGGMLDASYTRSNVVGQFGAFTITGAGRTAAVSYTHHYGAADGLTRYVVVGLEDKVFDPALFTLTDGRTDISQPKLRSRPLTLSYRAKKQTDTAYWDVGVSLSTNLPGGSGNTLQAYSNPNSKSTITTNRWQALRFQGGRVDSLPGGWLMGWRGQGQWASTELIAGEKFGLGGVGSLRGAGERVLARDSGLSTSLEFTSPEWSNGIRSLLFVDAGWLHGKHKPAVSVASLGLGLRYARGPVALSLDYGRIVNGSGDAEPLASNSSAPQRGDHKLHLNMSMRF